MEEITLDIHNSPLKYAKTLAIFYIIFGGLHAFVFAFWLIPALVLMLSTGSRGWENEFVRDAITGSSIFVPLIVFLPLITANRLLKKRKGFKVFVFISGVVLFLYSFLIAYITVINPISSREFGYVIYFLPCLVLSIYSLWFVARKRAV